VAFQHKMRNAEAAKMGAHREARLPATHNDGIGAFDQHGFVLCDALPCRKTRIAPDAKASERWHGSADLLMRST
jgi:hypothetical protein